MKKYQSSLSDFFFSVFGSEIAYHYETRLFKYIETFTSKNYRHVFVMHCKQLNKGQNGSMQAYIVPLLNKIFEHLARTFCIICLILIIFCTL